jgi:hypothetical protein
MGLWLNEKIIYIDCTMYNALIIDSLYVLWQSLN